MIGLLVSHPVNIPAQVQSHLLLDDYVGGKANRIDPWSSFQLKISGILSQTQTDNVQILSISQAQVI